ncbi:NADH-quinone oxidoreductase subunit NuoE [Phycisphaera mikurensis]|uniref:NADH-quinone oxidoreductase subunit E n=1 Tax=Phycisphaera mikurensis (strain NBRC 102666 / KCTC 22515 / FYK2301M01) TaxID=1142394 RepID=I0IEY6_PHYMF|nr:NADH-quinone oxidoreductase subunit NuoE [Phycisphaera mikurensis]MBB6441618.1 NADH-quinone oxidoreductase subunit E [Phycisphaera mikurensis]BAM03824.1 NADH-quinone oxidoreductase subunit E [Phycisphaera mikurensis NBRC 102666]
MAWLTKPSGRQALERRSEPYLSDGLKQKVEERYAHRYPTRRAMALPVLHAIQHEHNWLPYQAIEEAAEFLEIQPSELLDTATFYEEFFTQPRGKHTVWVCQSVSCEVMGEAAITESIADALNIDPGETTDDDQVTLLKVECIGACGAAPVALVDEELHENLTPASAAELARGLAKKGD